MRRTAVLLAVLLVAGCAGAPPAGTDGDLADDWRPMSAPVAFRPAAGECHPELTTIAPVAGVHPVDCAAPHVTETFHVGTAPDADVVPAPGSAGAKAAYQECSDRAADFLGGPWRGARMAVQVVWPTRTGWAAGARWLRCDLTLVDLDGRSHTSRRGSLAGELAGASMLRLSCFNPTVEDKTVTMMAPVPCFAPHHAEFAGLWRGPEISYAELERDTARSAAGCRSAIARFAGVPDDADLQYRSGWIGYNPTRTEWLAGERRVRCFLYFAKRTISRSARNAGPQALPIQ